MQKKYKYTFDKNAVMTQIWEMLNERVEFFKEWLSKKGIEPENTVSEYSKMLFTIIESELEDQPNTNVLFKLSFNDLLAANQAIDHLYGMKSLIESLNNCTIKNSEAVTDYSHLIVYVPPFFAELEDDPHAISDID